MKVLQLHVDYVEYEPIQPESSVYESAEKKPVRVEDALLLLTAVERKDDETVVIKPNKTKKKDRKIKVNSSLNLVNPATSTVGLLVILKIEAIVEAFPKINPKDKAATGPAPSPPTSSAQA